MIGAFGPMGEHLTLSILGWTIGSVVGAFFVLSAFALAG
jgi:hypothetical protein